MLLAQAAAPDMLGPILNVGLVGVMLLLLATETLFITVKSHKREMAAKDAEVARLVADKAEMKAALDGANDIITTQVIPTLTRVLHELQESTELRRDELSERRRREH